MPIVAESPHELLSMDGADLGVSAWILVDQARIDGFAEVTGDKQWIHVDPERAKSGPFGGAIAHGYLTLSLVNMFLPELLSVQRVSAGVNIGADGLRFLSPVPAGSRIRGRGQIVRVETVKNGAVQVVVRIHVEIEGQERPACVVDTISRYLPEAS
jgi:acyl dehydratase